MATVKVSSKGWVVIPSEFRKKYNVRSGTAVEVVDFGGGLSLIPLLSDPVGDAQGLLKAHKGLTGALLSARKMERKHEAVRTLCP